MSPVEQELQPITRNTKFKPEDESKKVIAEPKSNNRVKVKSGHEVNLAKTEVILEINPETKVETGDEVKLERTSVNKLEREELNHHSHELKVLELYSHEGKAQKLENDSSSSESEDFLDSAHPEQLNTYSTKKTVVQGMMDLALITANANQLRTLLEYGKQTATFQLVFGCIILSLCIQITVGLTLIVFRHKINTPYDHKERPRYIKRIDNLILAGVFLVTILNVFIATFTTFGDKIRHYPPSR
ncbi:hypothetical protein M8J77_011661 [Diaphorina citri]|nr:hypothetical protein M8J77_011661 [Diaphorina citri]